MKKYNVESRRDYTEVFDNYCFDHIKSGTKEEAVEFYKQWLIDNGCDPDEVRDMEYRVKEVEPDFDCDYEADTEYTYF